MKFRTTLAAIIVAFSASTASASVVNFTGPYVPPGTDMGLVNYGQNGTIDAGFPYYSTVFSIPSIPLYNVMGVVNGVLPAMSKITFSYTYYGMSSVYLDGYGSYSFKQGGTIYQGVADTNTGYVLGGTPSSLYQATTDFGGGPVPSLPLVWSTANITAPNGNGAGIGQTTILNNSNELANFATTFMAYITNLGAAGGTLTYNISAIPLPAALPLFGAVILGMFGFARFRSRKNASLSA